MRPRGTFGAVVQALAAAAAQGPGTVREICERAQVGEGVGRYSASRMVARGELVAVRDSRPMVLAAPDDTLVSLPQPNDLSLAELARITSGWVQT
jgi:hypothetical protein